MEALYKAYRTNPNVSFFLIYVNEAHPAAADGVGAGARDHRDIGRHRNLDDKVLAASKCMEGLKLSLPILIDSLDGEAETAYRGRPGATAVIDLDGNVAFYARGPSGVQPREAEAAIKQLLEKGGFPADDE